MYYYDKSIFFEYPSQIINADYTYAVTAKAQHEPQFPWFFTLVTAVLRQSKVDGTPTLRLEETEIYFLLLIVVSLEITFVLKAK